MPNDLPLPPELQHLLEKRSGDERRESDETDDAVGQESEIAPTKPTADIERRKSVRRSEDR